MQLFHSLYSTIYRALNGFDPIPDGEIQAEARRIMVEHGTGEDAVQYAEGIVQRCEGFKTKRQYRKLVKAERVLRATREMNL